MRDASAPRREATLPGVCWGDKSKTAQQKQTTWGQRQAGREQRDRSDSETPRSAGQGSPAAAGTRPQPRCPDLPPACGGPARPGPAPHAASPARARLAGRGAVPAPSRPPALTSPLPRQRRRSAPLPRAPLRSPRRCAGTGRCREREGAPRREPGGLNPRSAPRPSPPPARARSSSLAPEEASAQREPPGEGEGAAAAR